MSRIEDISYKTLQQTCIAYRDAGLHNEPCGGRSATRERLEAIAEKYAPVALGPDSAELLTRSRSPVSVGSAVPLSHGRSPRSGSVTEIERSQSSLSRSRSPERSLGRSQSPIARSRSPTRSPDRSQSASLRSQSPGRSQVTLGRAGLPARSRSPSPIVSQRTSQSQSILTSPSSGVSTRSRSPSPIKVVTTPPPSDSLRGRSQDREQSPRPVGSARRSQSAVVASSAPVEATTAVQTTTPTARTQDDKSTTPISQMTSSVPTTLTVPNSYLAPIVPRPMSRHNVEYYGKPGKMLGEGTFGEVYVAPGTKETGPVAIKTIIRDEYDGYEYLIAQLTLEGVALRLLSHPNLLKAIDIPDPTEIGRVRFVLPLADKGSLSDVIPTLSSAQKLSITYQLFCGLSYMHAYSVMHRDLKPQNVLVFSKEDGTLEARISDFGSIKSMFCVSKFMMTAVHFTIPYRAPELFLERPYGYESDVWAMGCMVYEIYTNDVLVKPSGGRDELAYWKGIVRMLGKPVAEDNIFPTGKAESQLTRYWEVAKRGPVYVPGLKLVYDRWINNSEIETLIISMLKYNPNNRSTIYEALQAPVFDPIRDRTLEWPGTTCQQVLAICPPYPAGWVEQPDINDGMVRILGEWLYEVGGVFKLKKRTIQMSIRLIDTYLAKKTIVREKLQELGVAAMAVAASYIEIYPAELTDFVYVSDNQYTIQDIWARANDILDTIEMQTMVDVTYDHFYLNNETYYEWSGLGLTREQWTFAQWISFYLIISPARFTRTPEEIFRDSITIVTAYVQKKPIASALLERLEAAKPRKGKRMKGVDNIASIREHAAGFVSVDTLVSLFREWASSVNEG